MIFELRLNQKMGIQENISANAVIVFSVMQTLSSLTYVEKNMIDNEMYIVMHQNFILQQVPLFVKSRTTLWRAMDELISAGLVKAISNSQKPMFAFTKKADSYLSNYVSKILDNIPQSQTSKKPLFTLNRATTIDKLSKEYYTLLKKHAESMCVSDGISVDEFAKFVDYHVSKGTRFKNYLSAFRNWIRQYKKYNPNVGESNANGMYQ